ncbi:MAG: hypothetical protein HYY40_08550 [Bacteroidetes bacterium]|nr:hypothetical protein [Bacteroidota bacterium]
MTYLSTILTLFIIFCLTVSSYGQETELQGTTGEKKFFDPSRLVFGGNFGLGLSGTQFAANFSPTIGYRVNEKFLPGAGITYIYFSDAFYNYDTHIYGGSVFGRYYIFENVFLYGEYEILNLEFYEPYLQDFFRRNITSILFGGGYRQHLGGRVYLNLLALWNFNDTKYSPYVNPVIRMGFSVGM